VTREPARVGLRLLAAVTLALFALQGLWPVVYDLVSDQPLFTRELELMLTSMLPLALLVLLGVIYAEARGGLR
jgi:hypothetical protein